LRRKVTLPGRGNLRPERSRGRRPVVWGLSGHTGRRVGSLRDRPSECGRMYILQGGPLDRILGRTKERQDSVRRKKFDYHTT